MLLAGMFMLFVSVAFPMVTVVVDTTPPNIGPLAIPVNGAAYDSVSTLFLYCGDSQSGIKSVTCTIDSTTYTLVYINSNGGIPSYPEYWNYMLTTPITGSGSHMFSFTVTNNAGLTTTKSGSFTIYVGLTGTWYVNNIQITSISQTVYATSATVNFKFSKLSGIADSSITCTVWEGTTQLSTLTNSATSTWTGSYTFANGQHTLDLKASDGTQTVTMSVLGLQVGPEGFELPQLNMLQIFGLASMGFGVLIIATSKKRR
jgi:hypothetical protein